eukprot:CAMPEP_0170125606 /NCGR_PEP_ID=MMETSP0020_2-20130122/19126_1 /TAXON_ID=98059 /ORGANISM="Dinobryon sp., Strain UTEXLB2267" /LENGTH=67 /DNA_ID=CAMNT_0010358269 /DNA_START=155 /DNA_END=358 /DNA_ORIENTATION=+
MHLLPLRPARGGGPEPAFRPVASGQELVVEGKGPQIVPQPAGDEPAAPRLVCLASPDTGDVTFLNPQ